MIHPAQRFSAPASIQTGSALKSLLDAVAVGLIADSLAAVIPGFRRAAFVRSACAGLDDLELKPRAAHIAAVMAVQLAPDPASAAAQLIASLGPELESTEGYGLKPFFYLPHTVFIHDHLAGDWPAAIAAIYAITSRFTGEFSIRPLLIREPERTLAQLRQWTSDPNPHVRRLVSEGSRPRLPWAERLPNFVRDPKPLLPLLDRLVDDPVRYVTRSVANHLGDIAKDHPELAFATAERWLAEPSPERCWVIRHAVRHPAKHGVPAAVELRRRAGARG